MDNTNLAEARLAAATETKKLSSYPRLKRALLRCQFLAILNVIAIPFLIMRDMDDSAGVAALIYSAIDVGMVVGLVSFSLKVSKNFKNRQWEQLNTKLGVAADVFLGFSVLMGIALLVLLFAGELAAAVVLLAGAAFCFATRIDFVRAKADLSELTAGSQNQTTSD